MHSPFSDLEEFFSPLPQLDGNFSPLSSTGVPVSNPESTSDYAVASSTLNDYPNPHHFSFQAAKVTTKTRKLGFALDQTKQLKKIVSDTSKDNFRIEVSSNKQNINIFCNMGFYNTIAIPVFKGMTTGFQTVIDDIFVQCQEVVGNFDINNAQQNTVLRFSIGQEKFNLGGVRIHLHHTTRNIQLQGGAFLPGNKKTSPIWFVENILAIQFANLSREKDMDISHFNNEVNKIVSGFLLRQPNPHLCSGCDSHFGGNSAPEFCSSCQSYYHKQKCFPTSKHKCYSRRTHHIVNVMDDPSLVAEASPVTTKQYTRGSDVVSFNIYDNNTAANRTLLDNYNANIHNKSPLADKICVQPSPTDGVTEPILPQLSLLNSQSTNTDEPSSQSNISAFPHHMISDVQPRQNGNENLICSALNPNAPTFLTGSHLIVQQYNGTKPKKPQKVGKKPDSSRPHTQAKPSNKHIPPITPADFENETMNKQLSISLAKIQELELDKIKLTKTNNILSERIKLLEKARDDDMSENFRRTSQSVCRGQSCKCECNCYPPAFYLQSCQHSCHNLTINNKPPHQLSDKVDQINGRLSDISSEIESIIQKMNYLGNHLPKTTNTSILPTPQNLNATEGGTCQTSNDLEDPDVDLSLNSVDEYVSLEVAMNVSQKNLNL